MHLDAAYGSAKPLCDIDLMYFFFTVCLSAISFGCWCFAILLRYCHFSALSSSHLLFPLVHPFCFGLLLGIWWEVRSIIISQRKCLVVVLFLYPKELGIRQCFHFCFYMSFLCSCKLSSVPRSLSISILETFLFDFCAFWLLYY